MNSRPPTLASRSTGILPVKSTLAAALTLFLLAAAPATRPAQLTSGPATLTFTPTPTLTCTTPGKTYTCGIPSPAHLTLLDAAGKLSDQAAAYSSIEATSDVTKAIATLTTPAGTTFRFTDLYSPAENPGTFRLARTVEVLATGPSPEVGFRTDLQIQTPSTNFPSAEIFIPGVWYADASHVPPSAQLQDAGQPDFLFRADRMALPMVMLRDKAQAVAITLIQTAPTPETITADYSPDSITDDRLHTAALGITRNKTLNLALTFPGIEGNSAAFPKAPRLRKRAERFHPICTGATQSYTLLIRLAPAKSFDAAMQDAWRTAYAIANPAIVPLALDPVYAASIDLLDHYGTEYNKVPGFPFAASLPDGAVRDVSMQMGFVGQQIPCAGHLITAGLQSNRPALVTKGTAIIDFWARESLTPEGLPRTWYDIGPEPHWRNYDTYMRVATDGMDGALQAWRRLKLANQDKPAWLAFCRKFGDWLLAHQNPDGSFFRAYHFDGKPATASKSATLHPVRFLVNLSQATNDTRYLAAARRAASFGIADIGLAADYVGGTPDNDDVKDKEAGWIAFDSFLALYDVTHDQRWLDAATRAATFTESWTYAQNIPIPNGDPKVTLPVLKSTAGLSLIATGHSGTDVYLAYAPAAYYRLYLYTNDPHFADVARLLLYNPRQLVDVAGSNHYARPGLLTEAFSLAPPRGHGVNAWLPWCTDAILSPMTQLTDIFGTHNLDTIHQLPLETRQKMNTTFATHRGFDFRR